MATVIRKQTTENKAVPRTDLNLLAQSLNATFIEQQPCPVKLIDKICANLAGTPENWAFARSVASQFKSDDLVFCPGEEIGIPLAHICRSKPEKPKIVVWFHRITGLRTRIALKLLSIANLVDLSVVNTRPNKIFLHNYLNIADERILYLTHPIDCRFFAPGISSSNKSKPMIVSVGLEQRDYRLLAAATEKLNVEVKVAGFSQFQTRIAKSFPSVLPDNMTNRKYQLSELIELYHDADLVVIPLKENDGAAGITALLEAMSCKKPIVCIRTKGLADYLSDEQAILTVEPGDVAGLQTAILDLLNNPEEARQRAEKAYKLVWERHNVDNLAEALANFVKTLED